MYHGLSERLADFALSVRYEDLPPIIRAEARCRLLDTFACAVGAVPHAMPSQVRDLASSMKGEPGVALFGGGTSAADWAAFNNGVHIRYLDINDSYASQEIVHPSDAWAAIFAAGELGGADGKAWLTAAVVAYELQGRLCDAAGLRARGFDHVAFTQIASALAAARLLGLDRTTATHAANIAGTTAPALRLTRAGELSHWNVGAGPHAARMGLVAALLARAGLTGPGPLFEGEMGFWQQVSGPFLLKKLGGPLVDDWLLPKTTVKIYPAAFHLQSAIAAALELRREIDDPRRIRSFEVATFRAAVEVSGKDPEKWQPRTRETATHSLPYSVAVALVDGEATPDQFAPERFTDPALLDLINRSTVVEDPELTAEYPACTPNRVTVQLENGQTFETEVAFPPGHPRNPLSDEQLRAKFGSLVVPVLGAGPTSALWDRLVRIDQAERPQETIASVR